MNTNRRLQELDALRGIAAVAVVFFHFTMNRNQALLGFNIGCMGVDLFFIISGFVIFMSIQNNKDYLHFIRGRFIRLFPAYWVAVTFTTLLIIIKNRTFYFDMHHVERVNFLSNKYLFNMSMLNHFFEIAYIDGPFWTLTVELIFYLFIVLLMAINGIKHFNSIGLVILFFCAIPPLFNNNLIKDIFDRLPLLSYFPLFFAGIIFYKMKFDKITFSRVLIIVLTLVVQISLFHFSYRNANYLKLHEYIFTLIGIYLVFLLLILDRLTFIVNPLTINLGRLSYSLYLIHQYLSITVLIPLFQKYTSFWPSAMASFIVVLLLAELINRTIERPAMVVLKNRVFKSRRFETA
ncbi:acyltransferase family protein [Adhaeribacter aquaticus]|uniref:acyltransferase family protein n=1 Tax=Adhaeribacter aquaticus TaxID=299567 RepID=UPI00041481CE|nr:acyltransferase [Adhaeribacter aquaticus]